MQLGARGKTAVITGGASGIGLEVAKRLGAEGVLIVLLDRDEAAANLQADVLRKTGIDVVCFTVDVADEVSVCRAFEKISKLFHSKIDILVNSAGIVATGSVEETSVAIWEKMLAVNVTGCFLCAREALPLMKAGGGKIINIASVAGKVGIPQMAAYCTSKAAVIGLTRQMAADYSSAGICINCVCPGTVAETEMGRQVISNDTTPEAKQKRLSKYPIGRLANTGEIASAVVFLATGESSFVCGAEFVIDGGMTAI
jgi:NAD(P)-dependent dehydrogenase (short-subunit alcohol dehydrogenase family)